MAERSDIQDGVVSSMIDWESKTLKLQTIPVMVNVKCCRSQAATSMTAAALSWNVKGDREAQNKAGSVAGIWRWDRHNEEKDGKVSSVYDKGTASPSFPERSGT